MRTVKKIFVGGHRQDDPILIWINVFRRADSNVIFHQICIKKIKSTEPEISVEPGYMYVKLLIVKQLQFKLEL
jgi:hypothetical protein